MYESTKCQYSKKMVFSFSWGCCWRRVELVYFLYIYGVFQEEQASKIAEQREIIEKQEAKLHVLLEDQEKLNTENKRLLTIQEIKIKLINREKYDLDNLTLENMTTSIHNDLQHLLTKNIQSIAKIKTYSKGNRKQDVQTLRSAIPF